MKTALKIFMCILVVVAGGCVTERQRARICLSCNAEQSTQTVTEVTTEVVYDTLTIPGDSSWYYAWLNCVDGKVVVIKEQTTNGGSISIQKDTARQADGTTVFKVKAKVAPKSVTVPGTKTSSNHSKTVEKILQPAPHACPKSRWWQWFIAGMAAVKLFNVVWRKVSPKIGNPLLWLLSKIWK